MTPPRNWFRVENSTDASVADIHIVDFIGSWDDDWLARNWGYDMGVTARAFVEQLAQLPESVKTINLHINSPGGDVQGGINIANALREQASKGRTVETFIDGIAASIASVIAMAGSKVHIGDNALMMVHNPWSIAIGNAGEMRKVADILDTMRGQIVNTYRWHSALEPEALVALMDAETWMDADQAIANGLATDKVAGLKAAASVDRSAVKALKVPDKFRSRVDALLKPEETKPAPMPALDIVRACADAGAPEEAEGLLARSATATDVAAHLAAVKERKAQASARETEIRAACKTAKLECLAEGYISGGMTAAAVRAHLTSITARLDKVEIDAGLPPDRGHGAKRGLNRADIYRKFNQQPA